MQKQLEFACAAAALNCLGVGARGGIESVENIERLMTTGKQHATVFEVGRAG
jgi:sulfofructose kinase